HVLVGIVVVTERYAVCNVRTVITFCASPVRTSLGGSRRFNERICYATLVRGLSIKLRVGVFLSHKVERSAVGNEFIPIADVSRFIRQHFLNFCLIENSADKRVV